MSANIYASIIIILLFDISEGLGFALLFLSLASHISDTMFLLLIEKKESYYMQYMHRLHNITKSA